MDVHANCCLDNIVAGGVQICGLHATVAPRRQQQQSPPNLEEFLFVSYMETECLSTNGKLEEELRLCKGKQINHLHDLCGCITFHDINIIYSASSIRFDRKT